MGKAKFIDRLKSAGDLQDKVAIKYLQDLDVTSKESYLWNYHVIRRRVNLLHDEVAVELLGHDTRIEKEEYEKCLKTTINDMSSNLYFISDDDAEYASKVVEGMLRIADKHSYSVFGLIQSCRLFELWMLKVRFNSADRRQELLKALDIAVYKKTIDFVISNISFHAWVESALKEIRSLYPVLHIVAGKSALEGNNRIARRIQKICGLYP